MPLSQRIPKLPGFKNPFKKIYSVVNVSKLSQFEDGAKVDAQVLLEAGLVRAGQDIKVLGAGRMKRKLAVEAHAFSNSAREAIEKAGGSVKVLGEPKPEKTEKTEAASTTESASPEE
jgi:large subunit ribosomal protein L15